MIDTHVHLNEIDQVEKTITAAIFKAPLERILIETDAPVEYRGEISEPANLVDTLRELSRIKNLPIKELARITTENARRFFGI